MSATKTSPDAPQWVNLGSVSRYPQLTAIYQAICGRVLWFWLPEGDSQTRCRIKIMGSDAKLVAVDHDHRRYIEQNPKTQSIYAQKARDGVRIVWVIDTHTGDFIGRIEDGVVWMKERSA